MCLTTSILFLFFSVYIFNYFYMHNLRDNECLIFFYLSPTSNLIDIFSCCARRFCRMNNASSVETQNRNWCIQKDY